MQKKLEKKLSLSKETLRALHGEHLQRAAGGDSLFTRVCCVKYPSVDITDCSDCPQCPW